LIEIFHFLNMPQRLQKANLNKSLRMSKNNLNRNNKRFGKWSRSEGGRRVLDAAQEIGVHAAKTAITAGAMGAGAAL
jgi:hypothetical protein